MIDSHVIEQVPKMVEPEPPALSPAIFLRLSTPAVDHPIYSKEGEGSNAEGHLYSCRPVSPPAPAQAMA
jgi:hypothetical protein